MKTKKKKKFGYAVGSVKRKDKYKPTVNPPTELAVSTMTKSFIEQGKKRKKNKFTKKALSPKKNDPARGESEDMKKALDGVRAKTVKNTRTGKHKTQSLAPGFYVTDMANKEYPHLKPLVAVAESMVIVLQGGAMMTVKVDKDRISIRKTAGKDGLSGDVHSVFVRPWSTNVIEVM